MRTSRFGLLVLSITLVLIAALSMHTFVHHQHYGEHSEGHSAGHSEHHGDESASTIEAFFHSQDKKLFLWMLLILISFLAVSEAKLIKRTYSYFTIKTNDTAYQDFITPFRLAFSRGIIQPKLY
jgi:hypothetical protein